MRNLTKIFLAVAAGLFAFSCVTDATEDLGIKVEGQKDGVYEVTISLEESRTQLGEKADGVYPLYWSEGDAISINGINSLPLAGVAEGATNATFSFTQIVERPFCVVYPAPTTATVEDEVVEEPAAPATVYPVNFLAEQPYTVGSFAPQAAPMYGYAAALAEGEEESAIQLNHLSGALRLALTGAGEKITSIKVKSEKGAIAGPFTVDCANGALTALEGASNIVNVSFAEGLVLGAEATPVYVAVPNGAYGTFVITINTEAHGKMTVKFNSDIKPINAGAVREFAEFVYAANTNDAEDVFEIDGKDALIAFAKIAGSFYPRTEVKVTANIDMTGVEWTPIAYFGEYEFDGGNFEIKGLSAPLFNKTSAHIKNLKLTDVDMTITDLAKSGAIVCELFGSLEGCSASGKININNTTFAPESFINKYNDIVHGGLVGMASGATVTNSTNNINITITSFCNAEKSIKSSTGGVVGGATEGCSFDGLVNNGSITYASTTQKGNVYISGIVGKSDDGSVISPFLALSNCTNNGSITSTVDSKTDGSLLTSGISGTINMEADKVCSNCTNNGTITHNGTANNSYLTGLAAYNCSASFHNCKNTADFVIASTAKVTNNTLFAGLTTGSATSPSITNCSNSGKMTIKSGATLDYEVVLAGLFYATSNSNVENCHNTGALTIEDGHTFKRLVYMAGLTYSIGGVDTKYNNCTNAGSLNVGAFTNAVTGNNGRLYMGGLFGKLTNGTYTNCKNLAGGVINASPKSVATESMIAGIVSYISAGTNPNFTDCANEATINFNPEYANGLYLGGLFSQVYATNKEFTLTFTRTHNKGDINVGGKSISYVVTDGTAAAGQLVGIGGLIGYTLNTNTFLYDCDCTGNITINPSDNCYNLAVGGIIGHHQHRVDNYVTTFDGCDFTGKLTYAPLKVEGYSRVGGFFGHAYGHTSYSKGQDIYNNCTVSGEVEISGEGTLAGKVFAGSFGGAMTQLAAMTSCSSTSAAKVNVSIKKISAQTSLGWIGLVTSLENGALYDFTSCTNSSTTNITSKGLAALYVSGMLGGNSLDASSPKSQTTTLTDCKVEGSVNISGKSAGIYWGGFCSYPYGSGNPVTLTRFVNDCDFNFTGEATGSLQLGGIGGYISASINTVDKCTISGDVNFSGTTSTYFSYGGYANNVNLAATTNNLISNFINTGNITVTGTVGTNFLVSGFSTQQKSPFYLNNITNTGNITLGTAEKSLTVGGDYLKVAGLFCNIAPYDGKEYTMDGEFINTGNITIQNTTVSKGTNCKVYVGGIVSNLSVNGVIANAKSYCDIKVLGLDHALIGGISANPRTTATVKNCSFGGNLILAQETGEDANGEIETYDVKTPITASNWFEYLYGAAITAAQAAEDECSHLATKPVIQ